MDNEPAYGQQIQGREGGERGCLAGTVVLLLAIKEMRTPNAMWLRTIVKVKIMISVYHL